MNKINLGSPVTGSRFIGRQNELKQIRQLMLSGQSVVLIAPRRFGKTSLAFELLNQLKEKHYSACIDIFSIPTIRSLTEVITEEVLKNKRQAKLFNKLKNSAASMLSNTQFKATVQEFEFLVEFAGKSPDYWDILNNSLDFINRFPEKNNKQLFCVFDEFGDINKLNGNQLVKTFRAKLQHHKNATYLFSGSYESVMQNIFMDTNSPFYRFARIIHLGFIEKEDFFRYYQTILAKENVPAKEDVIRNILDFTKGHPYYSQLALQTIIINYKMYKEIVTTKSLINELMGIERNYLEKVWEEIKGNKEHAQTLLELVRSPKGVYSQLKGKHINIARAIKNLQGKGFLFKNTDGEYELTDPLFSAWINSRIIK
jgi:hypothetical protein